MEGNKSYTVYSLHVPTEKYRATFFLLLVTIINQYYTVITTSNFEVRFLKKI